MNAPTQNAAAQQTGCSVKPAIAAKPRTVSVNGVPIPRGAIARETQNHPAAKPIEAWQAAARALAVRELLLQEARRIGLEAAPLADDGRRETEDEALVRQLIEAEVAVPKADSGTARRYYDQNRGRFRSPDLFEVSHILLPAGRSAKERSEERIHAEELVALLRADGSQFAEAALALSACPSREVGGNLGQIGPGQTVREFEDALAACPIGEVAPRPVETRYGFHIVRVDRRVAGRDLPFDMVEGRIRDWLEEKVRRTAIHQYIAILAGRAEIVGVHLEAARSPLVQ